MSEFARPWCCPEPRCALLHQGFGVTERPLSEPQPGGSFTCFGRMGGSIQFTYDGIEHDNDLNVCFIAATKGVVRFQMNTADLWHMSGDFLLALAAHDRGAITEWGWPRGFPEETPESTEAPR